jgi:tight adherence protein C
MIIGLGLGAGIGLGMYLIGRALLVRRFPLAVALADLDRPRRSLAAQAALTELERRQRWEDAVGRRVVELLEGLGVDLGRVRGDLRVMDRTIERHAAEKLTAALVGLATPLVMLVAMGAAGVHPPTGALVVGSLCFGGAGFLVPDALLRDAARRRRDAFRTSLSAYLDLVNVLLAGAAGTETALEGAAAAGDGWAFEQLRLTLDRARVLRESPWDAFAALGAELGIEELAELAASVRLAGEQGARIKASLAAKAAALRAHQLSAAEAAAQRASERMALPNVLMFLGFLTFAGYPALVSIAAGG